MDKEDGTLPVVENLEHQGRAFFLFSCRNRFGHPEAAVT